MWIFLAFLTVPLVEIALFIQVGGLIGLWPTLGIVVLTAIAGTWLVRSQGRMAMNNLRRSFSTLDDPTEPLAHGAMILVSGALLLTPGFFTDAVGFALLMPPVRVAVLRYLRKRVKVQSFAMGDGPHPQRRAPPARDDVIDGSYAEVDEDHPRAEHGRREESDGRPPRGKPSGWTEH